MMGIDQNSIGKHINEGTKTPFNLEDLDDSPKVEYVEDFSHSNFRKFANENSSSLIDPYSSVNIKSKKMDSSDFSECDDGINQHSSSVKNE